MEILSQPAHMTSSLIRLSTFYVTRNKIRSKSLNSEWQKKANVGILFFVRVMSFIVFLFAPEPWLPPRYKEEIFPWLLLWMNLWGFSSHSTYFRAPVRQINFDLGCPPPLSPLGVFLLLRTSLGMAVLIPISSGLDPRWPWPQLAVADGTCPNKLVLEVRKW